MNVLMKFRNDTNWDLLVVVEEATFNGEPLRLLPDEKMIIHGETEDHYFCTPLIGPGLVNVVVPKDKARHLNEREKQSLIGKEIRIN